MKPSKPTLSVETPIRRVSRQLRELMRRHRIGNASELEKLMRENGFEPVSQVTTRKILDCELRVEPKSPTLRRYADFFGERYESAFPQFDPSWSSVATAGGLIEFRRADGPTTPTMEQALSAAIRGVLGEASVPGEQRKTQLTIPIAPRLAVRR